MKVTKWIDWFITHPSWTFYLMGTGARKRLDSRSHDTINLSPFDFSAMEALLAEHFSLPISNVRGIISHFKPILRGQNERDEYTRWDSSQELCVLSYCLCRIKKPAVAVETGTAKGFLAAALLQAMNENHCGMLYSLELPPFGSRDFSYAGSFIPEELRANWNLRLGPSVPLMKKLLKELRSIDFFVHDSDHSYWNQKTECEIAMRSLNIGGILISDDVKNDAFQEVANAFQQKPIYLNQNSKKHPIGIIIKK